ncbi:hypothetical protein [Aquimarina sp. 2304DJ70-9]|uniref:hypothetical protein n=1 Tax=Aquimarina penaris TaxID=3231044 RepID=UPI0034629B8D
MKNITLTGYSLFLLFFISCGVPQADYDKLKNENEKLKNELAECELTPAQIFDQANKYYDAADYIKSRERLMTLKAKYVNSNENKKGKILLKKVEKKILETARNKSKQESNEEVTEEKDEDVTEEEDNIDSEANKKALAKMKKKYDINDHVTWYSDKSSTKLSTKNYIQTYIGKKEKKPWLGLSINYFSKKKWLYLERIEINVDGEIFEIEENSEGEFKTKQESGGKREWLDRIVKNDDMLLIKKIASGKSAKMKFVGQDDIYKRTISKTEKKAIQNVLAAYEALGGNL